MTIRWEGRAVSLRNILHRFSIAHLCLSFCRRVVALTLSMPRKIRTPIVWHCKSRADAFVRRCRPDLNSRIAGGANLCVRDTNRSAPSLSIPVPTLSMPYGAKHAIPSASANTFYAAAYLPPSPPSTPPSSLDSSSTAPIHFKTFNAKFERQANSFNLATSPSSSTDHLEFFGQSGTFLEAVLPNNAMARSAIPVEADGLKLALLDDDEADTRVLYAQSGVGAPSLCLRENLVALLDRADEELDCDSVIVVLNKDDQELRQYCSLDDLYIILT